jgi:HAE1 family hydrophobic/amphiphilic exporter-1
MKLIETTVKRPVTTSMFYFAVLLLSIFALTKLKVDFLPDFSFPSMTVITKYENVGPNEIEETVTRKVEEALATISNVKKIKSTSAEGMSFVSVEFEWGTNMVEAANDVRARLDEIRETLPEDSEKPIAYKFDISSIPVMGMVLQTDNVGLARRFADDFLKNEFEQVPGVARLNIQGGAEREIQIRVNKSRINALNISFSDIIKTVARENINTPGGEIDIDRDAYTIRTIGEYKALREIKRVIVSIKEYKQIPIGLREILNASSGKRIPIYLENVADVVDSYKERTLVHTVNNSEGIVILFQKQSGSNTVEVVKAIRKKLLTLKSRMPSNMKLYELFNTGDRITNSIANVSDSALIGGAIALLVLFFFLRNLRTTAIVGLAMPICIISTFLLMYFNKITLNIMSFGGLALGVGMLVDNAVVVIENIYRHREKGESATFAAIIGTKEVYLPVMASTLTTICVFLPVFFVEGLAGVLFKELALTVTFSLLASLVVAITLIPMLASKLMATETTVKKKEPKFFLTKFIKKISDWVNKKVSAFLDRMDASYSRGIAWALDHRKTVIFGALGLLIFSFTTCKAIPRGFMPQEERDNFYFDLELKEGTRIEQTMKLSQQVSELIRKNIKGVLYVSARAGTGDDWWSVFQGKVGAHLSTIRIVLPDKSDPKRRNMFVVQDEVRELVKNIPGAKISFFRPSLMGSASAPVEIQIKGYDQKIALELAKKALEIVKSVRGVTDAQISRKDGKPEIIVKIDRIKASSLGLSASDISDTIKAGFAGKVASRYREAGYEYDIRVRLRERDRIDIEDLKRLIIISPLGFKVPITQIASIKYSKSPSTIERLAQQRVIYVTANVGDGLAQIVSSIKEKIRKEMYPLPEGFSMLYGSEYQDQQESFSELAMAFLIAIFLVYMVMAAQFESFKHPFIILFTIPLSLIGILFLFFFTKTEFNINGFLGTIILVGIVVNNAIVLIDYVNLLRRDHGYSLKDSLIEAGRTRLRPILMTSLTTILGLMPMGFGGGEGSEARAPMARAIIGGLFSSGLLTLIVIPTVYYIVEKGGIKKRKEKRILKNAGIK